VTPGAVSRLIKLLEETVSVPLLVRGPHSTNPTPEGVRLAEELTGAFNRIDAAIEQLKPGPLTLSCSSSIMMYWLIPRIADFHERYPQIDIHFNMNYDQIDFMRDKISVAIRSSTIPPPKGAIIRELMTEWIGPVCSPAYLESARMRERADLSRARILATKTRAQAWLEWLTASGGTMELRTHETFEHFYLLIHAAVCGLGFAVVPHMLVIGDLESGKLVAPFGFVPGPRKLLLWIAPHLGRRPEIQTLEHWLEAEMDASLSSVAKSSGGTPRRSSRKTEAGRKRA